MSSGGGDSGRKLRYKNVGLGPEELRRRREEEGVQLRKQKREEQLSKRRNVVDVDESSMGADSTTMSGSDVVSTIREEMLPALFSDSVEDQIKGAQRFRKILSREPSPPINEVIEAGAIPRLVELLARDDCQTLQFEASWALTNVASGNAMQTRVVVQSGAVPLFIHHLQTSKYDDVQEQAIWALGNIAGDSPDCRDFVLDQGALLPLLNLLSKPELRLSTVRNAVWAVSNLCRGKNPAPAFEKVSPCLPVLARMLFHPDGEAVADACWALSYLCDGPNEKIQAVIDAGVCKRLVDLLSHSSPNVVSASLRTLGNIVTGDDLQTQVVLNCNILGALHQLLAGAVKDSIRKEACWAVSNITAGNRGQIQTVIEANIFPVLIEILMRADFRTRKEAAWAITNATSGGTPEQIMYLVEMGCVPPMCDLLSVQDIKIIDVALHGLENILKVGERDVTKSEYDGNPFAAIVEECYGLDKIEFLQSHENTEIYKRAFRIIETYFGGRDDEDVALEGRGGVGPGGDTGNFSF